MNLTELAKEIHEDNHKWWHDLDTGERLERNIGEMCMLIVSELAEAMEGARKNLQDTHLPHRKMEEVELADAVIRVLDLVGAYEFDIEALGENYRLVWRQTDNIGESLLLLVKKVITISGSFHHLSGDRSGAAMDVEDFLYMVEDYAQWRGFDLWGAVEEKREYNKTRYDHSVEGRKAAGGKKW
jgi:hypothetical protein